MQSQRLQESDFRKLMIHRPQLYEEEEAKPGDC